MVNAGAGGSIGVQVCGKNLFDMSALSNQSGVQHEMSGNAVRIYTTSSGTYRGCRILAITMYAGIKYVVTADVSNVVSGTPNIGLRNADTMSYLKRTAASDGRIVLTYTPTETVRVYVCLLVTAGSASDGDATFSNVQFEVGASATPYEPFKDGGSMTIATPNGLPGLPVDSGGNYTDASGQQWICDEIDFTRGTYIERIGSLTMDGSQLCAWMSYPTMPNAGYLFCSLSENDAADPQHIASALSDSFINRAGQASGLFDHGSFRLAVDGSALTFSLDGYSSSNSLATREWFKEHPATFLYVLKTPVETSLSADELAAFAVLKSQYPHTTVYTDGDTGMTLSYIADTKRYIDNKFAALAAASVDA